MASASRWSASTSTMKRARPPLWSRRSPRGAGSPSLPTPACPEYRTRDFASSAPAGARASGYRITRSQRGGHRPRRFGPAQRLLLFWRISPGEKRPAPQRTGSRHRPRRNQHLFRVPYRLTKSLAVLAEIAPEASVCVARELTKKFEEYRRGNPAELAAHYEERPPKGEITLLISSK